MELSSSAALGGGRHFEVVWGRTGSHMLGISSMGLYNTGKEVDRRKCVKSSREKGQMHWRRKWQPTPVFLPEKIPWTEEPGGLQIHRVGKKKKKSDTT